MRSWFVQTANVRLFIVPLTVALVVACTPVVTPSPAPSVDPTASAPTPTPTAARPSPSPSATPSASPSPAPTGATGTPPPVACRPQNGGDTFEFGPSSVGPYGMPLYDLAVVTQFVGGGSGRPVPVDGNAFVQVRFRNASTVDPTTSKQTFTQTDIRPGLPLVREVKLIDDFERVMTWGLGLERLACPKVTELAGPVRLVVDLPTPP